MNKIKFKSSLLENMSIGLAFIGYLALIVFKSPLFFILSLVGSIFFLEDE
ncbi:MAG: hypothetical protein L0J05_04730 [Tetragenococcus halophilus]|nr:hypothetical protein [Tetragenococcus halophilus]